MNKRWIAGLSLLAVLSLLVGGCESRPTAEEIVAQMRAVEANTEDAHAVVAFSAQTQAMDVELVVEMWEKKPDKFRAEVLEASDGDIVGAVSVTDGQQAWMYHPGENEVVVGDLQALSETGMDEADVLNPRQALEMMDEVIQWVLDNYDVRLVGEEDLDGAATYVLEFTPRPGEETALPIPIDKGTLWVEQERWIALQAKFEGGTLGQGSMRVRSVEFNVGVDDDRFRFDVPADADVIDVETTQPTPLTLDEARAQAGFTLLVPGYVPDGATLIYVFSANGAFTLHYDHSPISFTVTQRLLREGEDLEQQIEERFSRQVQEQQVTVSDQVVRDQTATLIADGQGNHFLTWTEDGVVVIIAGRIDPDEILRVAESLQ